MPGKGEGMGEPTGIVAVSFAVYSLAIVGVGLYSARYAKRSDEEFKADLAPLVLPAIEWDFDLAMDAVLDRIVGLLPGDPWKGKEPGTRV